MPKDLMDALRHNGMLEYGAVIESSFIRDVMKITIPEVGTRAEFEQATLAELSAVDYVRRHLLREGKYLAGDRGNYRILLPSENRAQVDAYMRQADSKLRRGILLAKYTPGVLGPVDVSQTAARLALKQQTARRFSQPSTVPN